MATKVSLDSIRALTFYKDEYAQARRTTPIPQLTCIGKPCRQYQPEVVRCVNEGGRGLDIQWKCEADLPEKLRFGKVEVSCEGWNRPGDTNVLKGSCALEYRLVYVPDSFRNTQESPRFPLWIERMLPKDVYETVFMVLWGSIVLLCTYLFFKSFCSSRHLSLRSRRSGSDSHHGRGNDGGSGGGGGGWFPSNNRPHYGDSPPPYSGPSGGKPSAENNTSNWQPGFWTGLGLGGVAASLWNSRRNEPRVVPPASSIWDWDRPMGGWFRGTPRNSAFPPTTSGSLFGSGPEQFRGMWSNEDREGPSNLGRRRTATTYGGTKTR